MKSDNNYYDVSSGERIKRLDVIKGIIAICVVLGHAKKLPQPIISLIFSFHVPCFFILSGYISSLKNPDQKMINFLYKKAKRILIPYLFFFVLGYIYWLLTCQIESKRLIWLPIPWWDPLIGLIDNSGPSLYVSPGLWFLPCLFLTQISFYILNRYLSEKLILCFFFFLTIVSVFEQGYFQKTLPFSLHLFILSNFFYSLGYMSNTIRNKYMEKIDSFYSLIILIPIWSLLSIFNGQVDLNNARYGDLYWLSIINALSGSLLVCIFSRYINWLFFARIGQTTLCILGFNFQLLSLFSFCMSIMHIDHSYLTSIISSIIIILVSSVLYQLLKINTPLLIGENR